MKLFGRWAYFFAHFSHNDRFGRFVKLFNFNYKNFKDIQLAKFEKNRKKIT